MDPTNNILREILAVLTRIETSLNEGKMFNAPLNQYGEGIGDAIQGQLVRGMKGIDQYADR